MIIGAIIACSVSFKVINTCGENNSELSQKLITRQLQLDLTIAALNENEYTLDKILKTLDYRLPRPITMEN